MEDRLNQINVGDEAELYHTISESDVDTFARLTGDDNPLHMNEDYSSQTHFRKRVVHGMLTASFISTIIGTKLPGEGALWYELQIRFLAPVRIGGKIKVLAKVKHKSTALRVITLEILITDENEQNVVEGEAKVKIIELQKKKALDMKNDKGAIIVTGGSRGIGRAISIALAAEEFSVVINYLDNEEAATNVKQEIISKERQAITIQADITNSDEVQKMVEETLSQFGTISGIVNNASSPAGNASFLDIEWKDVQSHLDVQVKGAFTLSKKVMPHFLEQNGGTIINIGSIYADGSPPVKLIPYVTAKSALISFSKSLAVEYGPKNIRINCVSPGMTQTDFIADVPEKTKIVTKMQTPLRQLAQTEDIGVVVAFLMSDKARHITGQNIRVCGGQTME